MVILLPELYNTRWLCYPDIWCVESRSGGDGWDDGGAPQHCHPTDQHQQRKQADERNDQGYEVCIVYAGVSLWLV